jgi:hypothetical protein
LLRLTFVVVACGSWIVRVIGIGTCSTWTPAGQLLSSGRRLNVPVDVTLTPPHPLSHCSYQRS